MSYLHKQRLAALFIEENGTAAENLADDAEHQADIKARADSAAAAAAADRRRAVLALDEANGKQLAAAALADTSLSIDDIRVVLGKVQNAPAPDNSAANSTSAPA